MELQKVVKMPRPKIDIDWDEVGHMLEAGCEGTEVAASIGIHPNTLYERCQTDNKLSFSEYLASKRASGDRLIRVKQFEIAKEGDKAMLIWLGKQRLGQKDKHEHSGDQDKPLQHVVKLKTEDLDSDPIE